MVRKKEVSYIEVITTDIKVKKDYRRQKRSFLSKRAAKHSYSITHLTQHMAALPCELGAISCAKLPCVIIDVPSNSVLGSRATRWARSELPSQVFLTPWVPFLSSCELLPRSFLGTTSNPLALWLLNEDGWKGMKSNVGDESRFEDEEKNDPGFSSSPWNSAQTASRRKKNSALPNYYKNVLLFTFQSRLWWP